MPSGHTTRCSTMYRLLDWTASSTVPQDLRRIVGMQQRRVRLEGAVEAARLQAEQRFESLVPHRGPGVGSHRQVPSPPASNASCSRSVSSRFWSSADPQVGDVLGCADDRDRRAVFVDDRAVGDPRAAPALPSRRRMVKSPSQTRAARAPRPGSRTASAAPLRRYEHLDHRPTHHLRGRPPVEDSLPCGSKTGSRPRARSRRLARGSTSNARASSERSDRSGWRAVAIPLLSMRHATSPRREPAHGSSPAADGSRRRTTG